MIDILIWSAGLEIGLVAAIVAMDVSLGPLSRPGGEYMLGWAVLPLAILLDAVVQAVFGNSLGKWLLGIRVLGSSSPYPNLRQAIVRNFRVYWSGLGTGIPPIMVYTLVRAHAIAKRGEPLSWEILTDTRTYGRNQSFGRTLFGATIYIGLAAGARSLGVYEASPEGLLKTAELAVNAKAPQQIDSVTWLDRAVAGPGRSLKYFYTIKETSNAGNTTATGNRIRAALTPKLVNTVCTNPDLGPLRDIGTTFTYSYSDANGRPLADIVVRSDACR